MQTTDAAPLRQPEQAGDSRFSLQRRFLRYSAALTTAYLCTVFFGLPLVFSNYYFNITETKQVYFLATSGLYLLALLFLRIALPPDYGVARAKNRPHPAALALALLFAVSLVGGLRSNYPNEVLLGENNRYQGLLTLLCYALLAFTLSRRTIDPRWPERAFLLGACIVCLLGVLNHFSVDPLGFTENLRASDRGRFLSTIGNADFYAAYVVLAFGVTLGFFLRAKKGAEGIAAALILAIASFGALVAGSDSAALGLLTLATLFPAALFSDSAALRRLPLGWGIFFCCAFAFGLLSRALPSSTYLSSFVTALRLPFVSLPLAAASLALWFALRRIDPKRLSRAKRPYVIGLLCALLLCALALLLLNTLLRSLPLGGLERYLRFSESWGTDRGKIWSFVMRVYAELPTLQKLFGAGPGALFHADAISPLFSDAALDTAHNEYLQYLITSGALGLCCYLAALSLAIRAGFRRSVDEPAYRGLTLAAAACAVQAAVNIAQPMTTPLFFLLLCLLISRRPEPRTA